MRHLITIRIHISMRLITICICSELNNNEIKKYFTDYSTMI